MVKYIICSLLANATTEDFENPIKFLESRIEMIKNPILNTKEEVDLGIIGSIGARLVIKETQSTLKSETPYRIESRLEFEDGYILTLPEIYAGSSNNKNQLYAILRKGKKEDEEEKSYLKQIRKGMIAKTSGAPEHYFLASALFLSLYADKEIEIVPLLVERWNAKRIASLKKVQKDPNASMELLELEQERIQNNLTNVFLRYFTKIEDVSEGIEITAVPSEIDEKLHLKVNENFNSRNTAFTEIYNLVQEHKSKTTDYRI